MKKILVAMLLIPTLAFAWEPTKPIVSIVGYGPGSGNEICFRGVIAEIERTNPKVNFLVQNMPGVDGVISTNHSTKLPPDGLSLNVTGNLSTYVTNEAFDAQAIRYKYEDLNPILSCGTSPQVIVAHPSSKINTAKDFVNYIKDPDKNVNIAIGSNVQYLIFGLIMDVGNGNRTKVQQVMYKGPMQALMDTVSGQTEFGMMPLSVAAQMIKSGKVKFIAVTGDKRHPQFPDIPKISEYLPGVEVMAMWNITLPKDTPQDIVDWYVKTFSTAIKSENVKKYFDDNYISVPPDLDPVSSKKIIESLRQKYLAKAINLKTKMDQN
jgi:tripartite-type tricarboxylate transporter receptor subunit TctC